MGKKDDNKVPASSTPLLTAAQRHAAGALFAIALHRAQIHHTHPPESTTSSDGDNHDDGGEQHSGDRRRHSGGGHSKFVLDGNQMWAHHSFGLLRPIFKFLEIDSNAMGELEEIACSPPEQRLGSYLKQLSGENGAESSETSDEVALANDIDAMALKLEKTREEYKDKKEKQSEYESACREKLPMPEAMPDLKHEKNNASEKSQPGTNVMTSFVESYPEKSNASENSQSDTSVAASVVESKSEKNNTSENSQWETNVTAYVFESKPQKNNTSENLQPETNVTASVVESKLEKIHTSETSQTDTNVTESVVEESHKHPIFESEGQPFEEAKKLSFARKISVLYQLLSACLANLPEDSKKTKSTHRINGYDARHRVALRLLATWFDIKWIKLEAIESMVACSAMALLKEEESEAKKSQEDSWEKWKRGGIIGAAALTGGAVMAISGGLAAPAIAASFSALAPTVGTIIPVIGASGCATVASVAGSAAGSYAVAASFGAAGAGLTGTKMAKRIGDIDEFEFKAIGENHNQGRLAVEILVAGFVYEEEDFVRPWEGVHDNLERYALQWESKHIISISHAIQDWLTSKIAKEIMTQGAMMTALNTLVTAVAWPTALLSLTKFIDSKWTIAIDRSDKAGKLLAEVLQKGLQGHRPVTLVGFSLGARVIFNCLQTLAEHETNAGIVERVVLLGAPIPISDMNWETTRKVVAGRYVNAYSTSDWMLGIAFRATLLHRGLAGIQPVEVPGIENVDVTEVIEGHSSYLWGSQQILDQLELDTYLPPTNHKVMKLSTPTVWHKDSMGEVKRTITELNKHHDDTSEKGKLQEMLEDKLRGSKDAWETINDWISD